MLKKINQALRIGIVATGVTAALYVLLGEPKEEEKKGFEESEVSSEFDDSW